MKKEKKDVKVIIAWGILILLIGMLLALNYIKFFGQPDEFIEERPVENSSEQAIDKALTQIIENFNEHEKIKTYADKGIDIKAILNHHSIYISYATDTTTTYEFTYQNLGLDIVIANEEDNVQKFQEIYEIVIYAVQQRLGNTQDISSYVSGFMNNKVQFDGLTKTVQNDTIHYYMNITKKIEESIQDNVIDLSDN